MLRWRGWPAVTHSQFSAMLLLCKWFSPFHSCGTYSVLSWSPSIVQSTVVDHYTVGAVPKPCKNNWGRRWNFFAKSAGRCFTPVIESKPNTLSPHWNFYADIQLIRGRFWLQLWTLKKFSEPRVSLNDGAKEVRNGESWTYLLHGRNRFDSFVPCVMCRVL